MSRPHAQYYFCQLSKFFQSQIVNAAAAQLASGRQATARFTATYSWLCHGSSCIFKETVNEFFATVCISYGLECHTQVIGTVALMRYSGGLRTGRVTSLRTKFKLIFKQSYFKKPLLSRKSVFHGYFVVYSRLTAPYTIRGRAHSI